MNKYFLILLTSISFSQQTKFVDFKSVLGKITINETEKTVFGNVAYDFKVLKTIDTLEIDAQNMTFSNVKVNGKEVSFLKTHNKLKIIAPFKNGIYKLSFQYSCKPKQTIYFVGANENLQIWTQGQGKNTSHWFPSFDDVNEKLIFNLDISFNKNFKVISNGMLKNIVEIENKIIWNYRMNNPMSSYLLMLAIGKFDHKTAISNSGIPLEMYFNPADVLKSEPTYRFSRSIFDFLENEIGLNYPWGVYKQIPVRDFLYAGMENTSATVFSQDFVVDSIGFNDRNYINVNAHELAHQWFGNLITAKTGKDHWLQEGFATYFALLAEQKLFGDDYFNWKMYEMAERLQQNSRTDTIPILNEKASSLTFYQKGAWALHILRTNIGKENFKKAVKNYLEKHKFKNVITNDFLLEINKVSTYDTAIFRKKWLESSGFEINEVLDLLKKNKMIQQYFDVAEMKNISFTEKKNKFEDILKSDAYYSVKEEVILQLAAIPFEDKKELIRLGMQSNDLKIRQAIAQNFNDIPDAFKLEYETLLDDNSYISKEIALNLLWNNFPGNQIELLEKTKNWTGFNDNNLKILWLTLALRTKNFKIDQKLKFYQELLDYASPQFETSTRQNAINNLIYLNKNDENYLPCIINGLTSHKWQMVKFCKEKIRIFLKDKIHRSYFETIMSKISNEEQIQLEKLLQE